MLSPEEAPTLIHRVAQATHDIVTPANAISALGLGLSIYGASHIAETSGVIEFGAGRVLDLADGLVARRTYPGSRLGAVVDGSFDKIAVGVGLVEAWRQHAAPESVLAVMALVNIVNAAANVYADRKGAEPTTSKAGKYFMFGYNGAFGALVLGNALGGNSGLEAAGWTLFAASTPVAAKASLDYTKSAICARKLQSEHKKRSHHRQRKR